jgi:hypothetical protein
MSAPQTIRALADFAAYWHSRAKAIFSTPSKELLKEKSLIGRVARKDSATTQFSYRRGLTKHLVS